MKHSCSVAGETFFVKELQKGIMTKTREKNITPHDVNAVCFLVYDSRVQVCHHLKLPFNVLLQLQGKRKRSCFVEIIQVIV